MATGTRVPAFSDTELDELKRSVVIACRILDREGVTDGYGHVSARIPGTSAFLTLANVSPGLATVDRLVLMDCDGTVLGGAEPPPNEWPIHGRVLAARPDVQSVCHTHSRWSTVFSVMPVPLRPLHHYGKFLPAGGPPVYQGAGLVRTIERGDALAACLGDGPAVLMRAHGDAVVGETIAQAVLRTVRLSWLGEIAHTALLHGEPRYLTQDELDRFTADERFVSRGWEYLVSRINVPEGNPGE